MRLHPLTGLAFAVAALALVFAVSPARADTPASEYQKCAKACADCQVECGKCFHHCTSLLGEGHKEHVTTARTCADCGEACAFCATLCARQSPMTAHAAEACAKCCDDCAAACEKFPEHKPMVECAKACKECAKACRDMLKALKP